MGEELVWMCLYHSQWFESEDAVRNHEDKMECVAVLVPRKDVNNYRLALQNGIIKIT